MAGVHPRRGKIGSDAIVLRPTGCATSEKHTTAAVQRYLYELAGDSSAEPVVRELLSRAARAQRLFKAMRAARPQTVRQFFALANQHMRC